MRALLIGFFILAGCAAPALPEEPAVVCTSHVECLRDVDHGCPVGLKQTNRGTCVGTRSDARCEVPLQCKSF